MLLAYTLEELMIEYLEDAIDADPNQRFAPEALADGSVIPSTGDPVIDQWERDLAEGRTPDFGKGLDLETRAKMERIMLGKKAAPVQEPEELPDEEFHDDYTGGG